MMTVMSVCCSMSSMCHPSIHVDILIMYLCAIELIDGELAELACHLSFCILSKHKTLNLEQSLHIYAVVIHRRTSLKLTLTTAKPLSDLTELTLCR